MRAGDDPYTPLAAIARKLRIPPDQIREEPSHAGAIAAIGIGEGIGSALSHVVTDELSSGVLVRLDVAGTPYETFWQLSSLSAGPQVAAALQLRRFIVQPEATRAILSRSSGAVGDRFRPAVHVTIWSGE